MALTDNILAYWKFDNNGYGGVSLLDSTPTGNDLTAPNGTTGLSLGAGVIDECASFVADGTTYLETFSPVFEGTETAISIAFWVNIPTGGPPYWFSAIGDPSPNFAIGANVDPFPQFDPHDGGGSLIDNTNVVDGTWHYLVATWNQFGYSSIYVDGVLSSQKASSGELIAGIGTYAINSSKTPFGLGLEGNVDEFGIWGRELSPAEIFDLYNGGAGSTYPFPPTKHLYFNNAAEDGDWANLDNWWQDSGFTFAATDLPTYTDDVSIYQSITQSTGLAGLCASADTTFWSANFASGLTLLSTGTVNVHGTSVFDGETSDGISMHDQTIIGPDGIIDGNAVLRDAATNQGIIQGNAEVHYDDGNGVYPIGGTVLGSVTYFGWPAKSPQWFNDNVGIGGGGDADFHNLANWWNDNTYTTRPLNTKGHQELPDPSTDLFVDGRAIVYNTGTANPTINSLTVTNEGALVYITLTVSNGASFSNGSELYQATVYGNASFNTGAYNYQSVIQGTAEYTSATSLVSSFGANSMQKLNAGGTWGSNDLVVNIDSGNNSFLARLLNLPWFINI